MIGLFVAVRSVTYIHHAVRQHKRGTLVLHQRIESRRTDHNWTSRHVRTSCEVECVKPLNESRPWSSQHTGAGQRHHVQHSTGLINDRCTDNPNLAIDIEAPKIGTVYIWGRSEVHVPNWLDGLVIVCVEGVDAVIHSGHIDEVSSPSAHFNSVRY